MDLAESKHESKTLELCGYCCLDHGRRGKNLKRRAARLTGTFHGFLGCLFYRLFEVRRIVIGIRLQVDTMAKTRHCNSAVNLIYPPANAVFPTTNGNFDGRTDQVPIKVKMAWGGVRSPVDGVAPKDLPGRRSTRGGVDRPRPAPSPEPPVRHRPAKIARPGRCVRSTDSTFYSPRTKLVFLKDVSAVHYRPDSNKTRFSIISSFYEYNER